MGFQPSLLAIVVGDDESKNQFRTQLYEHSEFKRGPVAINYENEQEGTTETMLVNMSNMLVNINRMSHEDDNYVPPNWIKRIHMVVHIVDPQQTSPTQLEFQFAAIRKSSPHLHHVVYFINPNHVEASAFDELFHSLGINQVYHSSETPSVHALLEDAAKNYSKKTAFYPPPYSLVSVSVDSNDYMLSGELYKKDGMRSFYQDEYDHRKEPLPLEVLIPNKFRQAIKNNDYDVLRANLIALTQDVRSRWDYDAQDFLSFLYQAVQENRIDILLLLYAYLPDLGIELPGKTPIEFIRTIQQKIESDTGRVKTEVEGGFFVRSFQDISSFSLSPQEMQKIEEFNPELIKQGHFSPQKHLNEVPQFFSGLENSDFKTRQQLQYSYAKFIKKMESFMESLAQNKFELPQNSNTAKAPSRRKRLIDGLTYPFQAHPVTNKRVTRENFQNSLVYKRLIDAVDDNNEYLAEKCLAIFRNKDISLDAVLNYASDFALPARQMSILSRLFSKDSLSILKVLCSKPDTLVLVQNHIRDNNLVSRTLYKNELSSSELLLAILNNPEQALAMLHSERTLAVISSSEDLMPDYTAESMERGFLNPLDSLFESIFSLSSNLNKFSGNLALRQKVADFVRENIPRSSVLQQLYLPLAEAQQRMITKGIGSIENSPQSVNVQSMELPGVKYLFGLLTLDRVYQFRSKRTGKPFFLKLFPHGIISIAENESELVQAKKRDTKTNPEKDVPEQPKEQKKKEKKEISEQSKGVVVYSGKKGDLKHPTGSSVKITSELANRARFFDNKALQKSVPVVPSQTPNILSDGKRYIPVSFDTNQYSHHGFWGSYKTYGAPPKDDPKTTYKAAVTGACMVGTTLYGRMLNDKGEVVQSIRLTHPNEAIPPGFRMDRIDCPFASHVYEHYNFAMLRETIPFIQSTLEPGAPLYYDLPTTNYLMYGMKYYLNGLMSETLFIEYVATIKAHDALIRGQLHQLEEEFGLTIIPRSTLDDLGFNHMTGEELLRYMHHSIPDEMRQADYQSQAACLAQAMIKALASQTGTIGTLYSNIPQDYTAKDEDPLLALSRLDYAALYAYAKLERANRTNSPPGDHDILGFMPQDEVHVFQSYAKLFAQQYGSLDAIDWLPTLMPQNASAEASKLFYVEEGIDELNQLIDSGLVHLQSMLASAITTDNPQLYMATLQKIIECLSTAEQENQRTVRSPY
ncbi:hypothetical protein [Legionella shakespearei]|uniref:Uncharacterized protein n=1 Tax=Legionella shakespearei DSM 23087 TaxID=1122169 RepID=A0A0W0YLJ7_9GAMM|nr:hypothetical protein [Legionella shakespearei]KTD57398.1 hypothetical protein Lsha_2583 [Legionella shakespearei DSM 23087]